MDNIKFFITMALIIVIAGLQIYGQVNFEEKARGVTREFIQENGQLIVDAVQTAQKNKEEEIKKQAAQNLSKFAKQIYASNMVIGNPEGSVKIIEFFDYNCGYCKKFYNNLNSFLEQDKDVAVYLIEFPILGEASVQASSIATAAFILDPEKYQDFHIALINHKGIADSEVTLKIAKKLGFNLDEIKAKATSKEVSDILAMNRKIAQELYINSTPTVIIGSEIIPGAISAEEIKLRVDFERKNKS